MNYDSPGEVAGNLARDYEWFNGGEIEDADFESGKSSFTIKQDDGDRPGAHRMSTPDLYLRVKVYRAKDGWRWRAVARNGRIVAESGEAYARKDGCSVAVDRFTACIRSGSFGVQR